MPDHIELRGLRAVGTHGVLPEEHQRGQPFEVDLDVEVDLAAAGRSDAYVELHINLWDVAAALVLLREAGAHVSPFLDGSGAEQGNPILACAPGIASELTRIAGI